MKNTLISIVLIILLASAGIFFFWGKDTKSSSTQTLENQSSQQAADQKNNKTFSSGDVSAHNSKDDCWLIVENKVYNVTAFIPEHPGGDKILRGCGKDATQMFEREREHQENNASSYLPKYYIGDLH